MKPSILGIGTATPVHLMSQDESLQMFSDIVCSEERQRRLARALFHKSGVKNRHTIVPHQVAYNWCRTADPSESCSEPSAENTGAARPPIDLAVPSEVLPKVVGGASQGPTTFERMKLYAHFAPELAIESAKKALANAGCSAGEITHLVTVSCTGFDAPGVDIELINQLQLPHSTQRVNVGFMGCHGAINGIRTALAIAHSDPQARVLLCAVELCSLHYRFQWDSEGIIGNALFADGSASMVICQQALSASDSTSDSNAADWKLLATGSCLIPDSKQAMSWCVGDHGFEMLLTSEVGDRIEAALSDWLHGWLDAHGVAFSDIDYWGVHPGGPRILSAVGSSLNLPDEALETSRRILSQNGNMSSPTVMFILEDFMRQHAEAANDSDGYCVLLAFGPGLVAEIALLRAQPRE